MSGGQGVQVGRYRSLRAQSATVPNAIAAFLLFVQNVTGKQPHIYFEWGEGHPLGHLMRYLLVGEGDIAPLTHEILRQAERSQNGDQSAMLRNYQQGMGTWLTCRLTWLQ